MTNIKTNILQFVENNKISMIPRWKFVLYSILAIAAACFSFALLVFVGSMIIFVLSTHGFIYLPIFGFGQLINSIRAIPVVLFLLTIILVIVIELLVRNYSFSFRKSVVSTILLLTASAIVLSYLLTLTPVHNDIRRFAKDHHLNFVYHEYDRPLPIKEADDMTILRGVVISTSTNSVVVQLFDDSTQIIYASTTAARPIDLPDKGDEVIVFGRLVNGRFEAVNIREASTLPF